MSAGGGESSESVGEGRVVVGSGAPESVEGSGSADRFGAHVSMAGGLFTAPGRAAELDTRDLQLFTKVPQRWKEPELLEADVLAFRRERRKHRIRTVAVHASYLINNASPQAVLWERSLRSLVAELERCHRIGADHLVIHPGSATDGDRRGGLARNARAIVAAVREVRPAVRVLLENTAGRGNVLGARPRELGELIARIRDGCGTASAVGACFDSCHLFATGHDLRFDYEGSLERWAEHVDLADVALWHLNDSLGPLGSAVDRHADIGTAEIGPEGFRNIVNDPRWFHTPKLIETPKEPDALIADRRNLARLRELTAD